MTRMTSKAHFACGVSILALLGSTSAWAQAQTAAADQAIEEVVVTGSLIRGAAPVGAPVSVLDSNTVLQTGAVTITDMMKDLPAVTINPAQTNQATFNNLGKVNPINIHRVGPLETLMLVDGVKTPLQGKDRVNDPSIIPAIALERVDILANGASATYGADAVAGVVNLVLKRNFDGLVTQLHGEALDGSSTYQASALIGKTWDGGDVAVSADFYNSGALRAAEHPDLYTFNATNVGYLDRTLVASSIPATITNGNSATYLNGVGGPCSNCFAVPKGLGPNAVVNFATLTAGTNNEVKNVFQYGDILPRDSRFSTTVALDQKLMDGISFFAEGYYSARHSYETYTPGYPPGTNNQIANLTLPVGYPYLTAGFPTTIRANYDFTTDLIPYIVGDQIDSRYEGGFKFDLPASWNGTATYAYSGDQLEIDQENQTNPNNVSALLGNTVTAAAVSGSPSQTVTFTKPTTLATLNVFCDPTAFSCLSPDQIAYIKAYTHDVSHNWRREMNLTMEGPIFSLPAGDVRLAIGGDYDKDKYVTAIVNTGTGPSVQIPVPASAALGTAATIKREIYAGFGELNVPLVSDENALPLIQKLTLQASARYDHYSDFGSTTNPKVGVNWVPLDGLTLQGSWGSSFRAPTLVDTSAVGVTISGDTSATTQSTMPNCIGGKAVPGSTGAAILAATGNTCATLPFSAALNYKGPAGGLAALIRPAGATVGPETSITWTGGAEYKPSFIPGLDVEGTFWNMKIEKVLGSVGVTTRMTDPNLAFSNYSIAQPNFANIVSAYLNGGTSLVASTPANIAHIQVINDGGTNNLGSYEQQGVDWKVKYILPWNMAGSWNVGVNSTYIFHELYAAAPGSAAVDISNTTTSGPENIGSLRFKFRANIGWTGEDELAGANATLYWNFQNGYHNTFGVVFPTSAIVPSFNTFDASIGYNLLDTPSNVYLKQINIQLVVNNIFDPKIPTVVDTAQGMTTFDGVNFSPLGRIWSLTVTKSW